MALFLTPAEHDANPPESWAVIKRAERIWYLTTKDAKPGEAMDTFTTKKAAEAAKTKGWLVKLYNDEGRWFAGETPNNWKPYVEVLAEQARRAAWIAEKSTSV